MKEWMIDFIRDRWFFEPGSLEEMTDEQVRSIYDDCCEYFSD